MEPNKESLPPLSTQTNPEGLPYVPVETPTEQRQGLPTPEKAPSSESREQLTGRAVGDNAPQASVTDPAAAVQAADPLPAQPLITNTVSVVNDNPLTADDIDVMEKEWLTRAKKILQDTRDDPHQKGQEVSRLQADYLQKRFGVQVKMPQG